jgi:two-component system sensor histidine kinase PilS (NtrC family)
MVEEAIPVDPSRASLRKLLNWYLALRIIVICFFLGGSIAYQLREAEWVESSIARYLVYLTVIAILQTTVSSLLLPRLSRFRHFINAQLCWDLLFALLVIHITGGINSLYSFLLILVIIAASVFCPRRQLIVVASAAAILYGSFLDLQYYGYLPMFSGAQYPTDLQGYDVFYAVFLHVGAFFLTALLSGTLADRLRVSEAAREQREVDFSDLEHLNQAILKNINSGLMIISPQGRIRSFNAAASKITGYRLEEVYNRPIEALFPEFDHLDLSGATRIERGETRYRKDGKELILGYSASKVFDQQQQNLGLLIAFQDLTEYKTLEEQLQQADRLAAVGRLASGMAHEIRNPLASISGSVQLLMEDKNISDENRRLMGIVVKEAERLSLLLSDFLDFAKPAPLSLEPVNIAHLLDELIELLVAGGRYQQVKIEKDYGDKEVLNIDWQKMRQAFWDLLINAAEAALPNGEIKITLEIAQGIIVIEDSGQGIAKDIRDKIFEPFFTTKEKGTGLGLANVYANIEAHGGHILVEQGKKGGARFVISLPENCNLPAQERFA